MKSRSRSRSRERSRGFRKSRDDRKKSDSSPEKSSDKNLVIDLEDDSFPCLKLTGIPQDASFREVK